MSRILIIEDEAAIRRVLKKIITEESDSYQVEEAEDGLSGIEMIKNNDYDLVLCDIKMPKMDGAEVLEAVKTVKPEIPMVMISGHGNIDTAVEAVKKGAFDFIQKPPDLNRLLITIRNAMDKSTLITEKKVLQKRVNKKSAAQEQFTTAVAFFVASDGNESFFAIGLFILSYLFF